jgi:hypothetical protein
MGYAYVAVYGGKMRVRGVSGLRYLSIVCNVYGCGWERQ